MSTRSSIFYSDGIHLFEETLTGEICIEVDGVWFTPDGGVQQTVTNKKYDALTMPREQWINLADSILAHLSAGEI